VTADIVLQTHGAVMQLCSMLKIALNLFITCKAGTHILGVSVEA
jgi:hypothetical protein